MHDPSDLDLAIRGSDGKVQLWLRAQPGASRSRVVGMHGERLKIALQAPPVDGKANDELIRYLADLLEVPRSRLELVSGTASRDKRVDIAAPRAVVVSALLRAMTGSLNLHRA